MLTDRLVKAELFDLLDYEPHAIQAEVHASTAQRRVLACGTRWGKTRCAAMECIAGALEPSDALHPRRGWVVAPDYTLADKVFREIVLIARERLPFLIREDREHLLVLTNPGGGFCELRAKTAENPTALLGEGLDFLVADEAARLKPVIWDSYLSARLMDKHGWALLISTPKGKGWFFDMWRRGNRGEPGWQSWNAPSESNPYLDKKELDERRINTPDAVFRQEYGAEFIEGAGCVFRNVREAATGVWRKASPELSYVAGLDLAQTVDFTVLIIMDEERRVVRMDRFHRLDWSVQIARLKAALERYDNPTCLVDSTGAGKPIYEQLLEEDINAVPYVFTNSSKAELISALALSLERGEVTLPKPELAPELIDELEAFQYSITDQGNVKTGAPPGYHDDCVTALGLANWQLSNRATHVEEPLEEWA